MIIDIRDPLLWYPEDCVNVSKLRLDMHTSHRNSLKILETEGIRVFRFHFGPRSRYYVDRGDARRMTVKHGSELARKRRLMRSAARVKGVLLPAKCRVCGRLGKQWRCGYNSAGNRRVKCGHCERCYTIGHVPPIQSTCVHCGSVTLQLRHHSSTTGNLVIRCGACKRYYTVPGNTPAATPPPLAMVYHSLPQDWEKW